MQRKEPPIEVQWLKKQKKYISMRAIEGELDLSPSTLRNFCKGLYSLNEEHWPKVVKWVREFKKM